MSAILNAYLAMPQGIYQSSIPAKVKAFICENMDVTEVTLPSCPEIQQRAKKSAEDRAEVYKKMHGYEPKNPELGGMRMAFFEEIAASLDGMFAIIYPDEINGKAFSPGIGLKIGSGPSAVIHTVNRMPNGVAQEAKAVLAEGKPVYEVVMDKNFVEPVELRRIVSLEGYSVLTIPTTGILNNQIAGVLASSPAHQIQAV